MARRFTQELERDLFGAIVGKERQHRKPKRPHGEQLGLGLATGPTEFGQWFTSADFPPLGSRPERWSKRNAQGTVWVTIEPEPGNPYCRLQSGGPGREQAVPWSELRSKVEARRADLWRNGYRVEYTVVAQAPPAAQRETFSGAETVDWAELEAEAKRRFGPEARVGYQHTRPNLDSWRPVGYVGGHYPVLLPKE